MSKTEYELSRALAVYHFVSDYFYTADNPPTVEETKKILDDYINPGDKYPWIARKLLKWNISRVNWNAVIQKSFDTKILDDVRREIQREQIRNS